MILEQKLKKLPTLSGIYQYFDKDGRLLYVGKAKNLKNRVKSYFKFTPNLTAAAKLGPRIHKMVGEISDMNYIITPSENDALILENSLIKQLKPKYNILLRDDKTYPYIYVDAKEDFPRLEITRKILKGSHIKYYGPYSIGAKDMLDSIYDILPLVQKKSCVKGAKACLFYQIKKCLAPCEGKISKKEYAKIVDQALHLLNNKNKLITLLHNKMEDYSEQFRFEEALELRNRIKSIEKSQ
ncbi:MAG: GIY-YIG nuclease family protein, partial [Campylobacterota bacterium]|nr:GIY-YIG nuclease family protein [Campylobacterota bacterium]